MSVVRIYEVKGIRGDWGRGKRDESLYQFIYIYTNPDTLSRPCSVSAANTPRIPLRPGGKKKNKKKAPGGVKFF